MKVLSAEFVTSAASAAGLPPDGLAQLALVGRSNVGKSTLINALVRQRVARTSAAPGKTRLINLYRVTLDRFAPVERFHLVDLPGYGYARGGEPAREGFAALMDEYFGLAAATGASPGSFGSTPAGPSAVVLVVDARHPGLPQDVAAWEWIQTATRSRPDPDAPPLAAAVIASKIDKLSRADRTRALSQWTQQLKTPVLPVSAETGEGLDDLWTLIVRLLLKGTTNATRTGPSAPTARAAVASDRSAAPAASAASAASGRPTARSGPGPRSGPSGPSAASGHPGSRARGDKAARQTDRSAPGHRNNGPSGPNAGSARPSGRRSGPPSAKPRRKWRS